MGCSTTPTAPSDFKPQSGGMGLLGGIRSGGWKHRRSHGLILAEVIIVLTISGIILVILAWSLRTMMIMTTNLARQSVISSQSKNAIGQFTADVGSAVDVVETGSNSFILEESDGDQLKYEYNSVDGTLERIENYNTANETTTVILGGVPSLEEPITLSALSFTYLTLQNDTTAKPIETKKIELNATLSVQTDTGKAITRDLFARVLMKNRIIYN